jgi:hypothetical protein
MRRIDRQQPMQQGRAAARQAGDVQRRLDRSLQQTGIRMPGGFEPQPIVQRALQLDPGDETPGKAQPRLLLQRRSQPPQPLTGQQGAELAEPGRAYSASDEDIRVERERAIDESQDSMCPHAPASFDRPPLANEWIAAVRQGAHPQGTLVVPPICHIGT